MKVAIYSHSIPPAVDGVSRRFTSIIHELYKAGHEVVIFTLEKEPILESILFPEDKCDLSKPRRFKYVHLESAFHELYPSKRIAAPTVGNLASIGMALARERPDVIHCTADAITLQFGLVGRVLGIPVVSSIHTDVQMGLAAVGAPSLVLFLTNAKERMESALLDGCATTSASFQIKLKEQHVECDHVIKTAVLVDKFRPEAACKATRSRLTFGHPDAFLVVFVGRLAPEKGLDTLIAMTRAVDNCYLALVGDGPMASQLAQQHGAAQRLYCVPGFVDHEALPKLYASADAHATCSVFETLGNTVLEAHACGLPVVAPRAQGFVDTITDGSDGMLYDGRHLEQGIAALTRLRDSPQLRKKMGDAGRVKVLKQSPQLVVEDIVGWYNDRMETTALMSKHTPAPIALFRTFQLLGSVMLVLAVWQLYDLASAIRAAYKKARASIGLDPLYRLLAWSNTTLLTMTTLTQDTSESSRARID